MYIYKPTFVIHLIKKWLELNANLSTFTIPRQPLSRVACLPLHRVQDMRRNEAPFEEYKELYDIFSDEELRVNSSLFSYFYSLFFPPSFPVHLRFDTPHSCVVPRIP